MGQGAGPPGPLSLPAPSAPWSSPAWKLLGVSSWVFRGGLLMGAELVKPLPSRWRSSQPLPSLLSWEVGVGPKGPPSGPVVGPPGN